MRFVDVTELDYHLQLGSKRFLDTITFHHFISPLLELLDLQANKFLLALLAVLLQRVSICLNRFNFLSQLLIFVLEFVIFGDEHAVLSCLSKLDVLRQLTR